MLYEREICAALLLKIIENHDDEFLRRYLDLSPHALGPADTNNWDPFYVAAGRGTANALHMLLEHWAADPSRCWTAPDERHFDLLDTACRSGQIDNVRLLTERNLPWAARFGKIRGNSDLDCDRGTSPLLAAASSYRHLPLETEARRRTEEVIHYLLDMGACARDSTSWSDLNIWCQDPLIPTAVRPPLLRNTVLSLSIKDASADVVRRLVNGGADVHAKVTTMPGWQSVFRGPEREARDVTALHLGSYYFNAEGIQALFDHRGSEVRVADMVSCRDEHSRIPLHWATSSNEPLEGPGDDEAIDSITSKVISTIKLLLAGNPDSINARDACGDTPLHCAVRLYSHFGSSSRSWHYEAAKVLCESSAEAGVRDNGGEIPLHRLFRHRGAPQPHDAALVTLLVGQGANVGDTDAGGSTVMHFVAQNLELVDMVHVLLDHASCPAEDILRAVDAQGNTPLHIAAGQGNIKGKPEDQVRAQEAMMRALLPQRPVRGGGGGPEERESAAGLSLLDQRNTAGNTPRQLREERWKKWRQVYEARQLHGAAVAEWRKRSEAGMGRGSNPYPKTPSDLDSVW